MASLVRVSAAPATGGAVSVNRARCRVAGPPAIIRCAPKTLQAHRVRPNPLTRSSSADTDTVSVSQQEEEDQSTDSTAQRYSVSLSKPLGLILEEDSKTGRIYVAEVVSEGNSEKTGVISAGDVLISTSGYVYTTEKEYQGNMVRGGEQLVTMNVAGESFDTVMAAIGSHPGHIKVTLEFERPTTYKTL